MPTTPSAAATARPMSDLERERDMLTLDALHCLRALEAGGSARHAELTLILRALQGIAAEMDLARAVTGAGRELPQAGPCSTPPEAAAVLMPDPDEWQRALWWRAGWSRARWVAVERLGHCPRRVSTGEMEAAIRWSCLGEETEPKPEVIIV